MARLGDVATYVNGYAFKPSNWSDTGLPIIRIQDLTGNSYQANRYNGEYDKRFEVNDGDILISWSASLGVYIWTGEKAVLNQHIFKVVFDKAEVNKSFFVHQVQNILEKAASQAHGATMKHLTKPVFDALPFNLPSLAEQQHIASVLDKLSDLISLRKQQLAKLDDLVKARFVEMFGDPVQNPMKWNMEPLSRNAVLLNGKAFNQDELLNKGKYPVLRVGNFFSNRGWYYSNLELDDDKYCDSGDLLYAWSASFGARIWDGGKVIYHYHIWKILVGDAYCKEFLCKLLDYVTISLMNDTHGIAMMHLTKSGMEQTAMIVPPIQLQQQFVGFVNQINRQKLTIQQSLDKLEVLKRSLMQEYFGGA